MAETYQMVSRMALELDQEGPKSNNEVTQLTWKPTESLALVQRLLDIIMVMPALADALDGDAPKWLENLVKDNGAPD
jgi:hypothetical protein